jgi:hypothetical protein
LLAGEIKTVSPLEPAVSSDQPYHFLNLVDGFNTEPIRSHGIRFTDPGNQINELCVDLILEERSAGRRAPGTHVALVKQQRVHAFAREAIGHERPGDPAADDGDFTSRVFPKRRINRQEAVLQQPVGVSRT